MHFCHLTVRGSKRDAILRRIREIAGESCVISYPSGPITLHIHFTIVDDDEPVEMVREIVELYDDTSVTFCYLNEDGCGLMDGSQGCVENEIYKDKDDKTRYVFVSDVATSDAAVTTPDMAYKAHPVGENLIHIGVCLALAFFTLMPGAILALLVFLPIALALNALGVVVDYENSWVLLIGATLSTSSLLVLGSGVRSESTIEIFAWSLVYGFLIIIIGGAIITSGLRDFGKIQVEIAISSLLVTLAYGEWRSHFKLL